MLVGAMSDRAAERRSKKAALRTTPSSRWGRTFAPPQFESIKTGHPVRRRSTGASARLQRKHELWGRTGAITVPGPNPRSGIRLPRGNRRSSGPRREGKRIPGRARGSPSKPGPPLTRRGSAASATLANVCGHRRRAALVEWLHVTTRGDLEERDLTLRCEMHRFFSTRGRAAVAAGLRPSAKAG